jgi:uncharacterized protein YeaO (DUF488 family)
MVSVTGPPWRSHVSVTLGQNNLLQKEENFQMKRLHLQTFQIGQPRKRGEGLRIGTTRRPPRGVRRSRWKRDGYFDLWFPLVAPSATLLLRSRGADFDDPTARRRFFAAYSRELKQPPAKYAVALLAALAKRTPVAVGCYCADETRCHRSVLRAAIERAAD